MASKKHRRKKKVCGHRNPCKCATRRIKRKHSRRKKMPSLKTIRKWALKLRKLHKRSKNAPPLGSGARFKALVSKLQRQKGRVIRDPRALAAWIGRRKYGSKKLQQLAARGKWRAKVAGLKHRRRAANPRRKRR